MAQLDVPITFTENSAFHSKNNSANYRISRLEKLIEQQLCIIQNYTQTIESYVFMYLKEKVTKQDLESTITLHARLIQEELNNIRNKQIVLDSVTTTTHTIRTDTF